MSSETPNLPAAAERQQTIDGVMTTWSYDPSARALVFISTLKEDTEDSRRLEAKALQNDVPKGGDHIGEEFVAANLLSHPVKLTDDKTGELVDAVRTVMIGPDGSMLCFTALSALIGCRLLCHVYKDPPWEPAVRIRVRQIKKKGGRIWYEFDDLGRVGQAKKGK